ncbi:MULTISPECIES: ABC transporter permease [unclassified Streptomyces]|uniref:ABC transporter permease n=1 Tax=unclassified Streptomyces TaxID=2593676 RepID=UPI0022510100|nr:MULTISPECIES: ABC transporter permease [unclassified Streptomyces]MCX4531237.1 ABC transporter permease [Streptomyces sp. NBC_01669]WSA03177.1 ABC transporter permease [Streptomyces sp. NBC_00841]
MKARLGPLGLATVLLLGVLAVVTACAPLLAPQDPNQPDLFNALAGSSGTHPLGGDALGRDVLSRLMFGARTTLLGPLFTIVLSTAAGTVLAVTAAWAGGRVDAVISRLLDVLFAIPGIVFALVTVAVLGPGMTGVVAGLAVAYTPYVARVVRSAALRERNLPYIAAAWVQGRSAVAICSRHLLPNLRPIIVAQSVSALGFAIIDVAAISFLGLGVQPPTADWGLMVKNGLDSAVRGQPMEAVSAGVLIALVVVAVNLLGDRLGRQEGDLR